jgi:hypothetical protein
MGCCNPRLVFPINTCGRHESSNQNNHEPPTYLGLRLIHCCVAKTSSSHSSMCICNRLSRSPELSSSEILDWEMVNKVFGKRSSSRNRKLRTLKVITSNTSFVRPVVVFIRSSSRNRKLRTVPALKSYLIC